MIILDVSFGIFAFLPQGWIFMIFVILIECVIMTKMLNHKWFDKKTYGIASLSNIISGLIGIITTMALNGGWYLVVWFPWVSSNEIDISNKSSLNFLIIFYVCAFVLSLIIEFAFNWITLRKKYEMRQLLITTLITNIVSYAIGTVVLYSYSFGLI